MRKLLVLLMVCPLTLWAQKLPFKIEAAYKGGYEYNIYNSPTFYIHLKDDTLYKNDLVNSNFLHDLDVDLDFRKVIGKHKLRSGKTLSFPMPTSILSNHSLNMITLWGRNWYMPIY